MKKLKNRNSILNIILIVLVVVLAGLLVFQQSQIQNTYIAFMLNCAGEIRLAGDHITIHDSEVNAKVYADYLLNIGEYDTAYIYQGRFTNLISIRTTSDCYAGDFQTWEYP